MLSTVSSKDHSSCAVQYALKFVNELLVAASEKDVAIVAMCRVGRYTILCHTVLSLCVCVPTKVQNSRAFCNVCYTVNHRNVKAGICYLVVLRIVFFFMKIANVHVPASTCTCVPVPIVYMLC